MVEKAKATPARIPMATKTEAKAKKEERKERKEIVKEERKERKEIKAKAKAKAMTGLSLQGGSMTRRMVTISGQRTTERSLTIAPLFGKEKAVRHRVRRVTVTTLRHSIRPKRSDSMAIEVLLQVPDQERRRSQMPYHSHQMYLQQHLHRLNPHLIVNIGMVRDFPKTKESRSCIRT